MFELDEMAVLQGLIDQYLIGASSPEVAAEYNELQTHLNDGHLTKKDLHIVQKALVFFLPCFRGNYEMESILTRSLVRTTRMINA